MQRRPYHATRFRRPREKQGKAHITEHQSVTCDTFLFRDLSSEEQRSLVGVAVGLCLMRPTLHSEWGQLRSSAVELFFPLTSTKRQITSRCRSRSRLRGSRPSGQVIVLVFYNTLVTRGLLSYPSPPSGGGSPASSLINRHVIFLVARILPTRHSRVTDVFTHIALIGLHCDAHVTVVTSILAPC